MTAKRDSGPARRSKVARSTPLAEGWVGRGELGKQGGGVREEVRRERGEQHGAGDLVGSAYQQMREA